MIGMSILNGYNLKIILSQTLKNISKKVNHSLKASTAKITLKNKSTSF